MLSIWSCPEICRLVKDQETISQIPYALATALNVKSSLNGFSSKG